MILLALLIWLLRRRKRKLASQASAKDVVNREQERLEIEVDGREMLELEHDDPSRILPDGNPRYEVPGSSRPQEVGSAPRHELQGHGMYCTVNH